ncbi:thiopeptide-type bacteriocin biosynthesis protein [Nocardiopsis trehalosi]|uniref:thiopeptide-type bacteriocin biosynthesis protein n=1 Tax=Nocardiopsis trehalosi TaxID=109329 RepID=UPI001FE128F6|nr:thiopeptide-type bacteriocin biosynthesis protein [Nocardiopsis trehalosi]
MDGRAHEITLAVTASHPRPLPSVRPRTAAATGRNHGHLPGAPPWAYAKVYAVTDRHLELLTDHLPDLLGAHGPSPLWWFIRYRDPEPHLRLRIRIDDSPGYAAACHAVATWARNLREAGLVSRLQWDTYHPETGRYGAGATMTAAESVFAADSQAVLAQARFTAEHSLPSDAVTAAGLIHLAAAFTGSATTARRWIIRHPAPPPSTESHPSVRDRARALADPEQTLLRTLPGGDRLAAAWHRRAAALAAYRVTLAADDGAPDQDGVLGSLLHMHYIRAQGVDEDGERACRRLVRAVALAETADPRVRA